MKSLKSLKTAAVFLIVAAVLLGIGYDVQRSANKELAKKNVELVAMRNECVNDAKARIRPDGDSSYVLSERFRTDVEICGTHLDSGSTLVYQDYEGRMETASAILVFGVMFLFMGTFTFIDVVFGSDSARSRKAEAALRKEFVRMRVTSFQRRARLAKREIAMRQLELARS